MCWRPRESSCEDSVADLVRSLRTCARIRSLTTGTFNLIVKDRTAIRLSGAHSVQLDTQLVRVQPSSKPYKHTLRHKTLSIRSSHRISTGFPHREGPEKGLSFRTASAVRNLLSAERADFPARNGMAFRSPDWKRALESAHTKAQTRENGRQKIEKRSFLEVLALKVPFGNRVLSLSFPENRAEQSEEFAFFRIQSRGRDNSGRNALLSH